MEHRDDDDEDVSFAKWMSSFWGHSWIEEDERGLRDRHRSQHASYRKTSLPCPPEIILLCDDIIQAKGKKLEGILVCVALVCTNV
uniref:Leukemia NUP98 fusion partner 1 n=1 Tax=Equus asinus asinus TaxID=83772 RepID=A0A8C4PM23_EQUAS